MQRCVIVVLAGLTVGFGCKSDNPKRMDTASEEKIALVSVPPKTVEAFKKDHADVSLERVRKIVKDNGDVHYEFRWVDKEGKKGEAEYDGAGLPATP